MISRRLTASATAPPATSAPKRSRTCSRRMRRSAPRPAWCAIRCPPQGGIEPETIAEVRAYAPAAFRTQERAVTEADYAAVTERHPGVQRAIATFRWTGSWHTVFITVDRLGGAAGGRRLRGFDSPACRALSHGGPRSRNRRAALRVVGDRHARLRRARLFPRRRERGVAQALQQSCASPTAGSACFIPTNSPSARPSILSPLIAAAQAVPGVTSVQVESISAPGNAGQQSRSRAGKLELGRLEIARCDNDPNFAEHGVFNLSVGGGK